MQARIYSVAVFIMSFHGIKMDTQSQFKNNKAIIEFLAKQFPNCFSIEGDAKPLKVGIFQDIATRLTDEDALSRTKLRLALRAYTASWRYLHCVKEGAERVDLDGVQVDTVSKEHAEHAAIQLQESKAKVKAKREAIQKADQGSVDQKVKKEAKDKPQSTSAVRTQKTNKSGYKPKPKLKSVDLATLTLGETVNVQLGRKPITAEVLSIEKDLIKVKIPSGMELTVKAEHILTK